MLFKMFQWKLMQSFPKSFIKAKNNLNAKICHSQHNQENPRSYSLVNRDAKNLNKMSANRIQQHIKKNNIS